MSRSFVLRESVDEKKVGAGNVIRREEDRAFAASLDFLASKARSRLETVKYLSRKGFSGRAAADAVGKLEHYGYLNDEEYARMVVDSRVRLNPRGVPALRGELSSKGVDERTIDKAVQGIDERECARLAVERGLYRWRGDDRRSFFRKVMAFLGRRGFPYDVASEVCNEAWESVCGNSEEG
ncbi:MAG: regulatory protein RecX [Desulfatiglandaceae bacterium]